MNEPRIAVIGLGAIGQQVLGVLRDTLLPGGEFAALRRPGAKPATAAAGLQVFTDVAALEKWRPRLAIECAGHAVVAGVVPHLLRSGTDVIVASVGALADEAVRTELAAAANAGGGRLLTVAGAIGGLDALSAGRAAGIHSVRYIGRKPPKAWSGTPAERLCDLNTLSQPTSVFEGSAATAARLFPKNANVTAAIALAGIGFEKTAVSLIADPTSPHIIHELEATGGFGRFSIRLENNPLPDNPRTSWLAALSIEAEVSNYLTLERRRRSDRFDS